MKARDASGSPREPQGDVLRGVWPCCFWGLPEGALRFSLSLGMKVARRLWVHPGSSLLPWSGGQPGTAGAKAGWPRPEVCALHPGVHETGRSARPPSGDTWVTCFFGTDSCSRVLLSDRVLPLFGCSGPEWASAEHGRCVSGERYEKSWQRCPQLNSKAACRPSTCPPPPDLGPLLSRPRCGGLPWRALAPHQGAPC